MKFHDVPRFLQMESGAPSSSSFTPRSATARVAEKRCALAARAFSAAAASVLLKVVSSFAKVACVPSLFVLVSLVKREKVLLWLS